MSFKQIILIIILTFSTGKAYNQLSNFNWSESVVKEGRSISKIINLEERSLVVFSPQSSTIRFDVFDKGKHSFEDVTFRGTFIDVFKVGNSVVVFSSIYNETSKKDEVLAKVIHQGNVKEVVVLDQSLYGTSHSDFKISVSPDFEKIVVLTEKPHKKGKETVVLTVLNSQLKMERSTDYLMSGIQSQKRKINVPIINNEGEVYLLKRYREEREESSYYILAYAISGSIFFDEFKLNYKPIQDVNFTLNEEGNLIIGGTYSSPNSVRSEGTYIAKFNAKGEKLFRKEYGFSAETMLAFTSERALKKEGLGLYDFRTNQIVQQKENITIVLEHRAIEANSKSPINTEKREGLIVQSFDLEGNFAWDKSLAMHQVDVSEKGYWNSFICFNDTANNKLSIIYNEVGYFDKKADNEFGEHVAVGSRIITIDKQGNAEKKPVKNSFKDAPIDLVISPKVTLQDGSKMLLIAEPLDQSVYVLGEVE